MNKQEQNLQAIRSKQVITSDIVMFSEWLAKYLNIDRINVDFGDLDEVPIRAYFKSRNDLTDFEEAKEYIEEIKINKSFDCNSVGDIVSYLISKDELPLALYEFKVNF